MFLSDSELIELTGYQVRACQRRWLLQNGWQFDVSRNGRPIIGRAYADQRLGLCASPRAHKRAWQPNIAAIQQRG